MMPPEPTSTVRPLLISVEPHPDEGLMSFIARAADANVYRKPGSMLSLCGFSAPNVENLPFSGGEHSAQIAQLLDVDESEIRSRMHLPVAGQRVHEYVDWFGTRLPRRLIETSHRRIAPSYAARVGYQPAMWSIRPITHCLETFEPLVSTCQVCAGILKWRSSARLSECSSCGAALTAGDHLPLPTDLRSDAQRLGGLVGPDHERRAFALDQLPAPFRDWEPGDVFHAIVDLGLIVSDPIAPAGCARAKNLSKGDFSQHTMADLVGGYRFVMQWPASAEGLIQTLSQSSTGTVRQRLGRLGKFFDGTAPATPLRELVRNTVPGLLNRLDVPLRKDQLGFAADEKEHEKLTVGDACRLLRIDRPTLRRLEGRGDCFVAKHPRSGGPSLYRRAGLEHALREWRNSAKPRDVAKVIGIPEAFVDDFADAGVFQRVANWDATLLANGQTLIDPDSVHRLTAEIARHEQPSDPTLGVPLLQEMQGEIHPQSWINLVNEVRSGRLPFRRTTADGPALDVLINPRRLAESKTCWHLDPLPDKSLSCLAAETVTGINNIVLGGAVKAGLIKGERLKGQVQISLVELRRFLTDYALAKEGARMLDIPPVAFAEEMRRLGYEPAGTAHHCIVWHRADVLAAVSQPN